MPYGLLCTNTNVIVKNPTRRIGNPISTDTVDALPHKLIRFTQSVRYVRRGPMDPYFKSPYPHAGGIWREEKRSLLTNCRNVSANRVLRGLGLGTFRYVTPNDGSKSVHCFLIYSRLTIIFVFYRPLVDGAGRDEGGGLGKGQRSGLQSRPERELDRSRPSRAKWDRGQKNKKNRGKISYISVSNNSPSWIRVCKHDIRYTDNGRALWARKAKKNCEKKNV